MDENTIERFDVTKLSSVDSRKQYNVEVNKRFQVLQGIVDPEEEHDHLIEVYREAAKKTIGISKKQSKPWIRDKTWRRVDERKALKIKLEGARSERLKERST